MCIYVYCKEWLVIHYFGSEEEDSPSKRISHQRCRLVLPHYWLSTVDLKAVDLSCYTVICTVRI